MDKSFMYSLMLFIIISSVFIVGCEVNNTSSMTNLPSNKYVAIQEELHNDGIIIAGNNPIPAEAPAPQIFLYNLSMVKNFYNKSGIFPSYYPTMNKSMKILLGTYYINNIPEHTRWDLTVKGIYEFPYKSESGVTILSVDKNGTVQMIYGNETISLNSGSSWTSPVVSSKDEMINGSYLGNNYSYLVKFTVTWTFINKGVNDK